MARVTGPAQPPPTTTHRRLSPPTTRARASAGTSLQRTICPWYERLLPLPPYTLLHCRHSLIPTCAHKCFSPSRCMRGEVSSLLRCPPHNGSTVRCAICVVCLQDGPWDAPSRMPVPCHVLSLTPNRSMQRWQQGEGAKIVGIKVSCARPLHHTLSGTPLSRAYRGSNPGLEMYSSDWTARMRENSFTVILCTQNHDLRVLLCPSKVNMH